MSTFVKTIKSLLTGDTIYPVTKASAVYMNDSTSQSPSTAEGHITALDSKVGDADMGTTATTLTGAIAEMNSKLADIIIARETSTDVTVNISVSSGTTAHVAISEPSGYSLLCNCNVTANGIVGVAASFDGINNINSINPNFYIFNSSNATRSGTVTLRVFSLFIKNNL